MFLESARLLRTVEYRIHLINLYINMHTYLKIINVVPLQYPGEISPVQSEKYIIKSLNHI